MRVDLHLHSRHSGPAAEWLLRRIGIPASYSEPAALYKRAIAAGMDAFTLTDRDTIAGCLELVGRPGVFTSVQITAHFPADDVPISILVWGITEAQHHATQSMRNNLYALQQYLIEQNLPHAVAHPLHQLAGRLTLSHIERLLLLFTHFQTINATRDPLTSEVLRDVLHRLDPQAIQTLAQRHAITPHGMEPWRKACIGGSDDRSGIFVAHAWTEAEASNVTEFLNAVREGRCQAAGHDGTPLAQAHGLYGNLFRFASDKFSGLDKAGLIGKAFSRFMEGENPTEFSVGEKLGFLAHGIITGKVFELAKPKNASLWKQFANEFRDAELNALLSHATAGVEQPERRAFITACLFADRLLYRFFTAFVRKLSEGKLIDAIQDASLLVPIALSLTPYFVAFRQLAPDRAWLTQISTHLTGSPSLSLKNRKRAWFTDTLEDVNGVATTIRKMTAAMIENGCDITVVTSRADSALTGIPLENFKPIGEFELPEYELQKLSFPPLLKIIDFIQREGFTELIISTPGPVGLTALLAARLLGLRTAGIYHTDFPQYVRILTEDRSWETLAWTFMRTFYAQMDTIWVNSESYRRSWIERGLPASKLKILPRGLDTKLFYPAQRDVAFWPNYGCPEDARVLLYVGRVSKEKNLETLALAWSQVKSASPCPVSLAVVGDGPFLSELRERIPDAIFTGYLSGEKLATAFASAHVFVFPSTTDTFGNVVIEAQACGLPCVVSDVGGPADLVIDGTTGIITRGLDASDFARGILTLLRDDFLRSTMSLASAQSVANRDWRDAARRWWAATDAPSCET